MTDKEISPASLPWNFLSKQIEKTKKTTQPVLFTVPKSNRKIAEKEAKSISLTHIYMTALFPGFNTKWQR